MKKYLFSKCKIAIPQCQKNQAVSLIMKHNLPCVSTRICEDRHLEIVTSYKKKDKFKETFLNANIQADFFEIKGFLNPIEKLKNRYGIILGLFFLISILIYSSKVVWKIEINGLEKACEDDILEQLERAGFALGTYIPNVDYDTLHNRVLMNSNNLSWISVNVVGNIATVEVKEKSEHKENKKPTYTNIVARYDGYIESIKVINGKKIASIGSVVKEGDILISGIINSQSEGVRYEQANGQVYAYVNKSIFVKIPFVTTKKEYTGKKYTEKSYKIYNFPINFLSKYGNQTLLYDTIEKKEKLCFLGISHLPIEMLTTVYYEYELKTIHISVSEAIDMAFAELRIEMDIKLKNAELIDKEIKTSYDSDAFYIECNMYCLEDIAKEQEFFVTK